MAIGTGAAILGSSLIGGASSLLGNKKKQTTTATNQAPAYLQPYLNQAAGNASSLYQGGGQQYYQGPGVVGMSDQTRQALQGIAGRAQDGSPLVGAANDFVSGGLKARLTSAFGAPAFNASQFQGGTGNPYANTANPYGAASNPYLDATFNKAALSTQNQLASEFARSGRNVGASQGLRSQQLNDLATNIYGGAYENERNRGLGYDQQLLGIGATGYENAQSRGLSAFEGAQGRQMQSAENAQDRQLSDISQQRSLQQGLLGAVLPLANQDYTDLEQLGKVGSGYDAYNQGVLTDEINRYNQNQARPYQALDDYIRRLTTMQGNTGTQTTTGPGAQSNVLGSAIGGGLLGSQLFGQNGIFGKSGISSDEALKYSLGGF